MSPILENEGLKFSKVSGDSNKIHIDNLTGYNSLFGTKICHGCLIIIKALKITNIIKVISKLKKYNIYINFLKNFTYNDEKNIVFSKLI